VLGHFSDGTSQPLTLQLIHQARQQLENADQQNQTVFMPNTLSDNTAAFLPLSKQPGLRHASNVLTASDTPAGATDVTVTFDTANDVDINGGGLQPVVKGHMTVQAVQTGVNSVQISPDQATTISVGSGL